MNIELSKKYPCHSSICKRHQAVFPFFGVMRGQVCSNVSQKMLLCFAVTSSLPVKHIHFSNGSTECSPFSTLKKPIAFRI